MRLKGMLQVTNDIIIPDVLSEKIGFYSNCTLAKNEIALFNMALSALSKYIIDMQIDLSNHMFLNVYISNDNEISIYSENKNVLGCQFYAVLYPMNRLRLKPDGVILFVIIEELAHYFLKIIDERLIKREVEKIYKYLVSDFTLEIYLKEYYND